MCSIVFIISCLSLSSLSRNFTKFFCRHFITKPQRLWWIYVRSCIWSVWHTFLKICVFFILSTAEFRHIWYCFLGPENYMRNRKKMSMAVTLVFLSSLKARHFQTMEWSHIWISKAHEISFSVISNNEIVGGMGFFRPHHDFSA